MLKGFKHLVTKVINRVNRCFTCHAIYNTYEDSYNTYEDSVCHLSPRGSLPLDANKGVESLVIPGSCAAVTLYMRDDYCGYSQSLFGESCSELRELRIEFAPEELIGCCELFSMGYIKCELSFSYFDSNGVARFVPLEKLYIDRKLSNIVELPYLTSLTLGRHIAEMQILPQASTLLREIVTLNSVPPSAPEFTDSQYRNVTVWVPTKAMKAYKEDRIWGKFHRIRKIKKGHHE